MPKILNPDQLEALRRLDTCSVANTIETFEVRLRNEGFADASVRCIFPRLPAMVGYAVTATIRCSGPPVEGHAYLERTDWWNTILSIPAPRIVFIQDLDKVPGRGSLLGEVHANILAALDCLGAVTNGAVRDLQAVEHMGFPLFAGNVSVSHSYAHIVAMGEPVTIGGLKIRPGDLIHGDPHGILSIPLEIADAIPARAEKLKERERKLIGLCRAPDFSLARLRKVVREKL